MGTVIVAAAKTQDRQARDIASTQLVQSLSYMETNLERLAVGIGRSDRAYANLVAGFDRRWADAVLGDQLYRNHGVRAVAVLDGDNRTLYSALEGEPAAFDALERFSEGLPELADLLRRDAKTSGATVVSGFLSMDGQPVLTAVAAVGDSETDLPQPVVVLTLDLANDMLPRLSAMLGFEDLRLAGPDTDQSMALLSLFSPSGTRIADLGWTARQPGRSFMRFILTVVVPAFLAIGALVWFLWLRSAHTAAALRQQIAIQEDLNRRLAENEARYRAFLAATPDLMVRISGDGVLLDHSAPRSETSPFRAADQLLGHTLADVLPVQVAKRALGAVHTALDTGQLQRFDYTLDLAEGQEAFEARLVPSGAGEVTMISTNITPRKEIERQLHQAKEVAEQASQAKTTFLAHMSHELRTPLNAIIGFAQIMEREMLGPMNNPRYREYSADIVSSGLHFLDLINDILDLAKIEATKYRLHEEDLDLDEVVGASADFFKPRLAESRKRIAVSVPPGLPQLYADRRSVRQMLLNLISNAIKFTSVGGRISVSARTDAAGCLALIVADDGVGIAPADHERVLEPFRQVNADTAKNAEGTGLGLPIVKKLVELHGGRLSLESRPGAGTRVILSFPPERVKPVSVLPRRNLAAG
ncbi:MAG: ATP-binding protein [Inquilinaceae bacterium]